MATKDRCPQCHSDIRKICSIKCIPWAHHWHSCSEIPLGHEGRSSSPAELPEKITIHEVFVKNPPGWFRKIANGPWESVSLAPYNGMLPVVWLKSDPYPQQRETWADPRVAAAMSEGAPLPAPSKEADVCQTEAEITAEGVPANQSEPVDLSRIQNPSKKAKEVVHSNPCPKCGHTEMHSICPLPAPAPVEPEIIRQWRDPKVAWLSPWHKDILAYIDGLKGKP